MTPPTFLQVMRRHPSAVNIIATGKAPHRTGMTVSAFMSLSAEPPTVVCAINRNAFTYARMAENQVFSVNTLGIGHVELAKRFAGQAKVFGDERFDEQDWDQFETGSPVLRNAAMSLECRLVRQVQENTHCLMIGEVLLGRYNDATLPLLYRDGQWVTTSDDVMKAAVQA